MKTRVTKHNRRIAGELNAIIHSRNLYLQEPGKNYRTRVINARAFNDEVLVECLNSGADLVVDENSLLFDGNGHRVDAL